MNWFLYDNGLRHERVKYHLLFICLDFFLSLVSVLVSFFQYFFPLDIKILGWCPAGPVLPHGEKVPL